MTATVSSTSISRETPRTLATLDRLLALPVPELERMYEGAKTPTIPEVQGDLRGRMLAWPMLEERQGVQGFFRAFAGSKASPSRSAATSATAASRARTPSCCLASAPRSGSRGRLT